MHGIDPEATTSALRLWIAAASAAVLVVLCVFASTQFRIFWRQPQSDAPTGAPPDGAAETPPDSRSRTQPDRRARWLAAVTRVGPVLAGCVLGVAITWALLGQQPAPPPDRSAERQALAMRAEQLTAPALAPGSPLACLDGLAAENIEAACEKALFASPASVASATDYVAAKLALLADMVAYTRQGGADIDDTVDRLRHSLESDHFGFLAYALAVRDGCTADKCKALALLRDPSHVRANLSAATLDHYVEHYLPVWAQVPQTAAAEVRNELSAADQPGPRPPHKLVDIDFPSASSIPPISIMNPEPKGPISPAAAAAAAADAAAAAAATGRRPRKQAVGEAPPADPVWSGGAAAPIPTAPARAAAAPAAPARAVPAATATAPVTAAAPATVSAVPFTGAPVQLNPFAPQPQASAGAPAHAQ